MEFSKEQQKAIIFTAIAIFAIIVIFLGISLFYAKRSNKNYTVDVSSGFTSIKEVIEGNDCKYIKDTFAEDREYPVEIELRFKYDLYVDQQSNENFYTKIINDVVKFVKFINVKMVDKEKDITIEIVCENDEISSITINGIEDYFIYMDSQINASKYEEIKTVDLNSTAEVLRVLNENNWSSSINCGSRDSIFKNYFIFFDEGIKYRKIGSKIYNIIFTENYAGDVINNVSARDSITSVKLKLGEPTFEDKNLGVVGYKGNNFYVFFTGKEISIYKNINYDYSDFWKLVDKFTSEDGDMTFKEFMNELTYIWPDYSEYTYDSDYMFISYPNRGIDVKLNYQDENGIVVYNNISENLGKVQRYLENTELLSKLQIDNVFEAEKRRINEVNSLSDKCNEFIENLKEDSEETTNLESNLFDFYMDLDENNIAVTTYFISKDSRQYSDRELNEPINSYTWINDNYFVYGIYDKGIYCYNVIDGRKQVLAEGKKDFKIKKFENNTIYFDNEQIQIEL